MSKNKFVLGLVLSGACLGIAVAGTVVHRVSDSPIFLKQKALATLQTETPALTPAKAVAPEGQQVLYLHPTKEEFDQCTVIDANHDGQTIQFYRVEKPTSVVEYPIFYDCFRATVDADEWIIMPAVKLDATDCLYQLYIDARVHATYYAEAFEVWVGTEPNIESMTQRVIHEPNITNQEFETFSGSFGITTPGNYYIGLHINSPLSANPFRIMLQDIYLSYTSRSAACPKAVADLAATPASDGSLFADVAFTMPSTSVNGLALATATELTAVISSPKEEVTVKGTPGQKITKRVAALSGANQVKVVVKSANGESPVASTSVWCAYDIPADPQVSASIATDNMSATITWPQVNIGINGGLVDPSKVTYNVYQYVITEGANGSTSAGWSPISTGLKECSYLFTATDPIQQMYELMVTAQNSAGETSGSEKSYTSVRLGALYSLPLADNFASGQVGYQGYAIETPDASYTATWGFSDASKLVEEAGSYGALCCITNQSATAKGQMALPAFTAKGCKDMIFSMNVWMDGLTPLTEVFAQTSTGKMIKLGEVRPQPLMSWEELKFPLTAECNDLDWCSVVLRTAFVDRTQTLMIRSYSVREQFAHDLGLENPSCSTARIGETMSLNVDMVNSGTEPMTASAPTATIKNGNATLATLAMTPESVSLQPGEKASFSASYALDRSELTGSLLSVEFAFEADNDQNPDNNSLELQVRTSASALPVVTDLKAAFNEAKDGAVLSWTNPISDSYNESFETYAHGDYSAQFGDWTNLDLDGLDCYTAQEAPFPNAVTPKAFQVINSDILSSPGFEPAEGSQLLMAFSAQGAATDDWLISPLLNPAGKLEFMTRILDPSFPETVKVLVSNSDSEFDSFRTLETLNLTTSGWTPHSFTLPADTKYVAINYCSNDKFAVMIDCLTYTPAEPMFNFGSFTLYSNDAKVAEGLTDPTHTFSSDAFGTNRYNVTVLGTRRDGSAFESPKSNTATIQIAGITEVAAGCGSVVGLQGEIRLTGFAASAPVVVADMGGRHMAVHTLADGSLSIPAHAGVYVVRVGSYSYKISVK